MLGELVDGGLLRQHQRWYELQYYQDKENPRAIGNRLFNFVQEIQFAMGENMNGPWEEVN